MKLSHALAVSTVLLFGVSAETAAWFPAHAAQPDGTKTTKSSTKAKKPKGSPQNAGPQNTTNPQGVTRPEAPSAY
jgi:hypothetical protein